MKFEVENNISDVVRKILTKMKIEGINSKNLKKKLRREPKKNTSKRPTRQRAAMYSKGNINTAMYSKNKLNIRNSSNKINLKEKKVNIESVAAA